MIGWLAAVSVFSIGAAQDVDTPRTVPPMEIHLRQADAVDLLHMLASFSSSQLLVVRPAVDVRVDYQHKFITPQTFADQLGVQAGLHVTRAGEFEVWVPACAMPEYRQVRFPEAKRLTLNFNNVQAAALLHLVADSQGLELSAPDGYPDFNLALYIVNRTSEEIASAAATAIGVEFKVVGKTLEIRPTAPPPNCNASQYRWHTREEINAPTAELPPRKFFSLEDCGRVAKFPASKATSCRWYESFPLADFAIRGYVALSPHSPPLAYIETGGGSPPLLAQQGDRFSEDFVMVSSVAKEAALLAQFDQREGGEQLLKRTFSVAYADGHVQDREATDDDKRRHRRDLFERYGLEDLLVVTTQQEKGIWTASIRTEPGLQSKVSLGSYLGPHSGRIVSIDADGLQVLELVQDGAGAWYERPVRLQIGRWFQRPRDILHRRLALPEIRTPVQLQFLEAASRVDLVAMASLIEQGADIDARYGKFNALFEATYYRKIDATETVRWLLDHGARADGFFGKYEGTPLTEAVERGSLEMTRLLLEAGAHPDLGDIGERTPLYYAAQHGHTEIARLLLAHHADPRAPSHLGLTPFLMAAYYGHADVVKLFVNAGIGHAEADRNGQTMLYSAVEGRQADLTRYLVGLGADVNARDRWGKSILDVAKKKGDEQIVALLLSNGARPGSSSVQASGK